MERPYNHGYFEKVRSINMNHKEILARSWKLLWSYRVLWVFGFILALTTSSFPDQMFNGNGSGGSSSQSEDFSLESGDDFQEEFSDFIEEMVEAGDAFAAETFNFTGDWVQAILTIAIVAGCLILLMIILSVILRYVSETALVKLVDENESSGEKHGVRQGFRMGFSRHAWNMFLANLVITLPIIIAFILLFGFAIAPFFLWLTDNTTIAIIGTVAGIGLFFLVVFLAILVAAALSLLKRFVFRVVVLEDLGPVEAIGRGYQIVRENFKDIILMWLIMIGIGLGFALLMIPVTFLMLVLAALVAGVLGLSVGGIASLFSTDAVSIIAGAVAGAPVFILLMVAPLVFLTGLKETFVSIAWTLSLREVLVIEGLETPDDDTEAYAENEASETPPELDDISQA